MQKPQIGQVVDYVYLWKSEANKGRINGVKTRPCLVLAHREKDSKDIFFVAPITHSSPDMEGKSIPIDHQTVKRMGLDTEQSWVVCTEVNKFIGVSEELVANAKTGSFSRGHISSHLLQSVRTRVQNFQKAGLFKVVDRDRLYKMADLK